MSTTIRDAQNLTESKLEPTARELAPEEIETIVGGVTGAGSAGRPVPTTLPVPCC